MWHSLASGCVQFLQRLAHCYTLSPLSTAVVPESPFLVSRQSPRSRARSPHMAIGEYIMVATVGMGKL